MILPMSTLPYQDYLNTDVTLMVQDMINDLQNSHGFMIKLTNEEYYNTMIFASNNYSYTALHPTLEVCYNTSTNLQNLTQNNFNFTILPNPSNGNVKLNYTLNTQENVEIKVCDLMGNTVYQSTVANQNKGNYSIDLNTKLASALYFVSIKCNNFVATKKLVVN